jgi:hypothetical protein
MGVLPSWVVRQAAIGSAEVIGPVIAGRTREGDYDQEPDNGEWSNNQIPISNRLELGIENWLLVIRLEPTDPNVFQTRWKP